MKRNASIRVFVLLAFVLPVTAYALFNMYESRWERLPVLGPLKQSDRKSIEHTIAGFSLVNQDNRAVSAGDWTGKIIIADFFFTHCPVVCPKMTANLKKVSDAFGNDSDVKISSFSVDPARDSTAQLKKYAARFGIDARNWDLLTGDKKEIYKLARNSFLVVATDGDGGPDDFIHSEKLVLIDKAKRIRGYYDGTSDKETNQLLRDIKKLKDEN